MTYNGWTNYATWKVALEVTGDAWDALNSRERIDVGTNGDDREWSSSIAAGWARDRVADILDIAIEDHLEAASGSKEMSPSMAMVTDWARSFLHDVNWLEIAEYWRDDVDPIVGGDE